MNNIKPVCILGLSCFYHDAAATLVKDGKLIAAAAEERFSRKKHDASFPEGAVDYCLKEAGIKPGDLDYVGFYEKPFLKFERILETYLKTVPKGFNSFRQAIPIWFKEKLWIKNIIQKELGWDKDIVFLKHHLSHAASSFLVSPFQEAAILTLDGVGEWETATKGVGKGNKIELKKSINFPHSLGLLYSAFTYYCGFRINNGEYKMMGLAPYGEPKYEKLIKDNLIEIKDNGGFRLNMKYFSYEYGLKSINQKFINLFDNQPPLKQKSESFPQHYKDVAASIQKIIEEVILKMIERLYKETKN
jgi:carbamoyltransferase